MLFRDTYSLIYEIETDDVYKDSWKDKDLLDFSEYSKSAGFDNVMNEMVVDKMKDETESALIIKFFGLRSKIYSLVKLDNKELRDLGMLKKSVAGSIRHNM